jgi:large subunit ribosomal protein L25
MAREATLVVQKRSQLGSAACRRLRSQGLVPGNVYGHDAAPEPISVENRVLRPLIFDGMKVVDVELDGRHDKAIVREIQWDAFGIDITHIDLFRVDPNERVQIEVPIELKGTAPGVLSGGMLEQPLHKLSIDCLAYLIPDSILVKIGNLQLGQTVHVSDLEIPEGIHVRVPADTVVVHVIQVQVKEEAGGEMGIAEPEVVGKKAGDAGDTKEAPKKK